MCRSTADGGRRCTDHRALRKVDVASLRPAATDAAPPVAWGDPIPTATDLYSRFEPDVAAATIAALEDAATAEPAITADVITAAPAGCRMHGLEYRMKSPGSLAAKIDKKSSELPYPTPHDISGRLTDFVRYTVVTTTDAAVADAAKTTLTVLIRRGWTIRELEHSFVDGNPYKGLHAIARHRSSDMDVEIQFHSERGIAVKDAHHADYEVMRDASQPRAARAAAFEKMAAAWDQVDAPAGVDGLVVGGIRVVEKEYRNQSRAR